MWSKPMHLEMGIREDNYLIAAVARFRIGSVQKSHSARYNFDTLQYLSAPSKLRSLQKSIAPNTAEGANI